jgi:hypothetical protein
VTTSPAVQAHKGDPGEGVATTWGDMVKFQKANPQAAHKRTYLPEHRSQPKRQLIIPGVTDQSTAPLATREPQSSEPVPTMDGREAQAPAPTTDFNAKDDTQDFIPPDTNAAAGPSHIMVALNGTVKIFNKSTQASVSDVTLNSFWSSLGSISTAFDPKIIYDENSSRFIFACDANGNAASNVILLGISANSDPTGTWYLRKYTADSGGTTWADYPMLGVNERWIAINYNMFTVGATPSYSGCKMWVFDKSTVIANANAYTPSVFATAFDDGGNGNGFNLSCALTFGTEATPTLYMVDSGWAAGSDDFVRLSKITGTASSPSWSQVGFINVQDFGNTMSVPQSGDSNNLDGGDTRVLSVVRRTSGNGSGLWYCHTAGLPAALVTHDAALWHRIDPTVPSLTSQGAVEDTSLVNPVHYVYPSLAVTSNGDMGMGFSGCGAGQFAGAYYVNRPSPNKVGGSGQGVVQPVYQFKPGLARYFKGGSVGVNRWGDYSATFLDPSDGLIWTIQEYARTNVGTTGDYGRWGTWLAKFNAVTPVNMSVYQFD